MCLINKTKGSYFLKWPRNVQIHLIYTEKDIVQNKDAFPIMLLMNKTNI